LIVPLKVRIGYQLCGLARLAGMGGDGSLANPIWKVVSVSSSFLGRPGSKRAANQGLAAPNGIAQFQLDADAVWLDTKNLGHFATSWTALNHP
jgi:hypothetical protein